MDCVDEVLEFHDYNSLCTEISAEMWMNNYIIKMMSVYKNDNLEITNGLILLLNLLMIDSPDRFNKIGKSGKNLSKIEREVLRNYLLYEFEFSSLSK